MKTIDGVFRLGTGEGRYEATRGVKLSARQFGDTVAFNCTAAGDLRLDIAELRRVIIDVLRKLSEAGGTPTTGVPGVIAGLADALTALRCVVETEKGLETRPEWWRGWYHKLVADQHRYCWPRAKVPELHAVPRATPADQRRASLRRTGAAANVVGIAELRQARLMAEATAAAERAAQAERQRIATVTRVEPSGQLAAAF